MTEQFQNRKLFFIDAETDGLHGSFIAVAIIVTDSECNEINRSYIGIKKENLVVNDPWTRENVLPILGEYREMQTEQELLEEVWKIWRENSDAYMVGDVIFPVEARLIQRCIDLNQEERKFQGPYPFIDLSNILFASGFDPDCSRNELLLQLCFQQDYMKISGQQHNALYDVETTILLYKSLMKEHMR